MVAFQKIHKGMHSRPLLNALQLVGGAEFAGLDQTRVAVD